MHLLEFTNKTSKVFLKKDLTFLVSINPSIKIDLIEFSNFQLVVERRQLAQFEICIERISADSQDTTEKESLRIVKKRKMKSTPMVIS